MSSPSSVAIAVSIISWWRSRAVSASKNVSIPFAPRTVRSVPVSSRFSGERATRKNSAPSFAKHLAASWAMAEVAPTINILIFFIPSLTFARDLHVAKNWRRSVDQHTGQTLATWGKTPGSSPRSYARLLRDRPPLHSDAQSYRVRRAIALSSDHHRQNPAQGLYLGGGLKA